MAQVTRESTQDVSDQLTAIWNNFDDGTKSLEYYADAITALGAATASSSKEITQGLEKFAAIANTVGLSYEYATAALATVVANTRQSADVVGTAFKTLFARIQDLELGETLEDGVTLGKYSEAIRSVGIDILTQNGELKDMDMILDELGAKWDSLSKAQQTSLAQTVAGMRQYTQFIAIMDNYDEFKVNVDIASDAEGTLTEQWETWAKNYEGAAKRVEQRSNELYGALLDDDLVIGVTNAFADTISIIGKVADAMGGLGPIIFTIIALFSKKLIPLISQASAHFIQNFKVMTGAAQRESAQMQATTQTMVQDMLRIQQQGSGTASTLTHQYELINDLFEAKKRLNSATKLLSKSEMEEYQTRLASYEAANQELQASLKLEGQLKRETAERKLRITSSHRDSIMSASKSYAATVSPAALDYQVKTENILKKINDLEEQRGKISNKNTKEYKAITDEIEKSRTSLQNLKAEHDKYVSQQGAKPISAQVVGQVSYQTYDFADAGDNKYQDAFFAQAMNRQLNQNGYLGEQTYDVSINSLTQVAEALGKVNVYSEVAEQSMIEFNNAMSKVGSGAAGVAAADMNKLGVSLEQLQKEAGLTGNKAITDLVNRLKQVTADTPVSELQELEKELLTFQRGTTSASGSLMELSAKMMTELVSKTDITEAELKSLTATFEKFGFTVVNNNGQIQILRANMENLNVTMSRGQGFATLGGQIATTTGQLYMLVTAFQMLKNAFSEEATAGEKFVASLMAVSMIMPALTSIFNKEAAARVVSATAALFQKSAQDAKSASDVKEAATTGIASGATGVNTRQRTVNTAATWAQKVAGDANNLTMLTTMGIMLAVVAVGVLVLVGIIALVTAIQKHETAEEKNAKAIEKSTEALSAQNEMLQSTQENLEAVNSRLDEMTSLLDQIRSYQDAFDNLVVGSTAWKENLEKNNEAILELLKLYPELNNLYADGTKVLDFVSGVYQINDFDALEQYIKGTNTLAALNAEMRAMWQGQQAQEMQAQLNLQKTAQAIRSTSSRTFKTAYTKNEEDQDLSNRTIYIGDKSYTFDTDDPTENKLNDFWADEYNHILDSIIRGEYKSVEKAVSTQLGGYSEAFQTFVTDAIYSLGDLEEAENKLIKVRNQIPAQLQAISSNIASTLQGYGSASAGARGLATDIITRTQMLWDPSAFDQMSQEDLEDIARIVFGKTQSTSLQYNSDGTSQYIQTMLDGADAQGNAQADADWGDYFARTIEGQEVIAKYLKETQNIDASKVTLEAYTDTKFEIDGTTYYYKDILSWVAQKGALQAIQDMDIFKDLAQYDQSLVNVLGGEVLALTQAEYEELKNNLDAHQADIEQIAAKYQLDAEELKINIQQELSTWTAESAKIYQTAQSIADGNAIIAEAAEKNGLDVEALKVYASELQSLYMNMDYKTAAKLAVENAKYTKGVEALSEALNDNIKDLKKWKNTGDLTYKTAQSLASVKAALKDVFGFEVSNKFIEDYNDYNIDVVLCAYSEKEFDEIKNMI